MLRDLMRPLLAEFSDPFFTRGAAGLLAPGFGTSFGNLARRVAGRPTSFNVRETDKEVVVEAEAPGYSKENLSVQIEDDMLIITGAEQKGKEEGDFFERQEFKQAFTLPMELRESEIKATYKDGILRVSLPKPESMQIEKKRVSIPIEAGATEEGGQAGQTIEVEAKGTTGPQS